MNDLGRLLMIAGAALVVVGLVISTSNRTGLGRLPGDFFYRRGNFGCYFPLVTSILLSIVLSVLLWLFTRR